MIREQTHLLHFDQKLVDLREEYQGRINYALDLAERRVLDERGRVAEETSQMFAKMDCEWRAAFSEASSSHRARLEAIEQDLSVKVNTGQLQVRQLTSELRRLEQVHDRNSKRLAILLRRNVTLRAPVEALTEEVEKMEAKVRIFHDSIEPELILAKLRAKELDAQIREKAFILECLTQQRLQLESHRNVDMKYCYLKDLHERAISIAETDVTMYHPFLVFSPNIFHRRCLHSKNPNANPRPVGPRRDRRGKTPWVAEYGTKSTLRKSMSNQRSQSLRRK
jgi:chromosome segregation ATPase